MIPQDNLRRNIYIYINIFSEQQLFGGRIKALLMSGVKVQNAPTAWRWQKGKDKLMLKPVFDKSLWSMRVSP